MALVFQECIGAPQLPEGPSPTTSQHSNVIATAHLPDITKIEDDDRELSDQLEQMDLEGESNVGAENKQESEEQDQNPVEHAGGPHHIGNHSIATIPTAEQVARHPQLSDEQQRVIASIGMIVMGDVGYHGVSNHKQLKHTAAAAYLHEVVGRNPKPVPAQDPVSQLQRLLSSIKLNENVAFKAEYKKNTRMSSILKIQYSVTIRRIEI